MGSDSIPPETLLDESMAMAMLGKVHKPSLLTSEQLMV